MMLSLPPGLSTPSHEIAQDASGLRLGMTQLHLRGHRVQAPPVAVVTVPVTIGHRRAPLHAEGARASTVEHLLVADLARQRGAER